MQHLKKNNPSLGLQSQRVADGGEGIPPSLTSSVNEFLKICSILNTLFQEGKDESFLREAFSNAFNKFNNSLNTFITRDLNESKEQAQDPNSTIANFVRSAIMPWLLGSTFAWRSLVKPRKYAGDFEMIQMLYDKTASTNSNTTFIGHCVDEALLQSIVAESVRNRCRFIENIILNRLKTDAAGTVVKIMSVGCGPCQELFHVLESGSSNYLSKLHFYGIDIDRGALDNVRLSIGGLEEQQVQGNEFTLHKANVIRIIHSHATDQNLRPHDSELLDPLQGQLDIVYSMGLTDYFDDNQVIELLNWMYDLLLPGGGIAVVGNFAPCNPLRGWMDYVVDWRLVYRTKEDLLNICKRSKCGGNDCEFNVECVDGHGIQLFLMIRRITS